jgi:hypothetical protein
MSFGELLKRRNRFGISKSSLPRPLGDGLIVSSRTKQEARARRSTGVFLGSGGRRQAIAKRGDVTVSLKPASIRRERCEALPTGIETGAHSRSADEKMHPQNVVAHAPF